MESELDEQPCTESYCKLKGMADYQSYLKYRIRGTGEPVYMRDEMDKQMEADLARLSAIRASNQGLIEELGLESAEAAEAEMQAHLRRLHQYNELKDVGQALLGRLAVIRETTTRTLYPEFGLDIND